MRHPNEADPTNCNPPPATSWPYLFNARRTPSDANARHCERAEHRAKYPPHLTGSDKHADLYLDHGGIEKEGHGEDPQNLRPPRYGHGPHVRREHGGPES